MPHEQIDWIRLDDVLAAADRCLAPIGPELAGFIVLETAQRLREIGGVLEVSGLAIGTSGHVALTAPPERGNEETATRKLRELLARLLTVSTSATPALRQCSKRREHGSLALLCRELEAALIPLNRAASRRGLARVARATADAIDSGRLDPVHAEPEMDAAPEEVDIEPPPVEVAARPRVSPPPLPTMDGHAPRRARVDASAIWHNEPTGARLDVPFALTAATVAKWPAASGVVPLRANSEAPRGLLRATSTPNGATLWVVVDPTAITGVPCGNSVDLMVVPSNGPQKTVHVDWATFAGSPPRAVATF